MVIFLEWIHHPQWSPVACENSSFVRAHAHQHAIVDLLIRPAFRMRQVLTPGLKTDFFCGTFTSFKNRKFAHQTLNSSKNGARTLPKCVPFCESKCQSPSLAPPLIMKSAWRRSHGATIRTAEWWSIPSATPPRRRRELRFQKPAS